MGCGQGVEEEFAVGGVVHVRGGDQDGQDESQVWVMTCRLRPLIFLPASMPWPASATFVEAFTLCASITSAVGCELRPWDCRVLSRSRSWTCCVVPSASHLA